MVEGSFMFGAGGGSYTSLFPYYRLEALRGQHYMHAHNDYLQFIGEVGLVGFLLLIFVVVKTWFVALNVMRLRRDVIRLTASFVSIMGMTTILIHSFVDFNLQIPSNALFFIVILSFGWVSAGGRHRKEEVG